MRSLLAATSAALLLAATSVARADDKALPKDFARLVYRQQMREPAADPGFISVTVARDGATRIELQRTPNVADTELAFKLSDAELADVKKVLAASSANRLEGTPAPDPLGPCALTIEQADGSKRKVEDRHPLHLPGLKNLFKKLLGLAEVLMKAPPPDAVVALVLDDARGAEKLHFEIAVAADGTVSGRFSGLSGTPSGRRDGSFGGRIAADEVRALHETTDENTFKLKQDPQRRGASFAVKIGDSARSMSARGALLDCPNVAPLVKRLWEIFQKCDAPAQAVAPAAPKNPEPVADAVVAQQDEPGVVRRGLAPPSVPEIIGYKPQSAPVAGQRLAEDDKASAQAAAATPGTPTAGVATSLSARR